MDESDRKFAPIVVTQTSGNARRKVSGGIYKEYWMIDNVTVPKDKLEDTATPDEAGNQQTNEISYTGYGRVAVARADPGGESDQSPRPERVR